MRHRFDYSFSQDDEYRTYATRSDPNSTPCDQNTAQYGQNSTPCGQANSYAAQLGQPDVEDCSNGAIPDKAEPMEGKTKILVPVLTTINKYLFHNYRLAMYTYVNGLRRNGTLSQIVGARVLNRTINKEAMSFPSVSFWRIDRTNFYADVKVQLKLDTQGGTLVWNGYLVLWCSFNAEFECGFECLTDEIDRKNDGFDPLDSYLIPYYNNKRVDEVTELIWKKYIPKALTNSKMRDPVKLAEKMGLEVKSCRIYEHRGVSTILFFEEDDLVVGDDRVEKDKSGAKERVKVKYSSPEHIMGNTIVVNENLTRWEHAGCGIFHECYHYEEHYMFYRLQKMGSNDPRKVAMQELIVDANHEPDDAIYFMEKQANRGAYGLMLPATHTREYIKRLYHDAGNCRHAGERYEAIGKEMRSELLLPYFRIRARMIQLGYIQAKGALNYAERQLIQPFAFDLDAWREEQHTFVIDRDIVNSLYKKNDDFHAVMDSGKFVYADGHIVRNDERFIRQEDDRLMLTDWANAHVDECCLRFVRVYVQQDVGRYVFGRMYYDADYVKQTQFYLSDLINSDKLDELDAQNLYIQRFPTTFKGAIDLLKKQNKTSISALARFLCMDEGTLTRNLDNPRKFMNEDYLTAICLYFKLPDWISRLVFKRAHFQLDEEDKRHRAIAHILRVQSNDGVEAANAYLERNDVEPLKI